MSGALRDAPPPTSISQVNAIANLRDLFESWCLLGPPSTDQARILSPGCPRVPIQEPPRVATPSSPTAGTSSANAWMPPPCPTLSSRLSLPAPTAIQVMPRQITFDNTPPPRVAIESRPPSFLPPMSPIAHRTRSCSNAPLALFAGRRPYHKGVTYHIPTAKSTRASEETLGFAGLCQAFFLCLPKKPMALHTSVQLLRKLIVLLPFPCLIQPQVNSLSITNCNATPVTRPLGILLMPMS
jgi:hypothetical protein